MNRLSTSAARLSFAACLLLGLGLLPTAASAAPITVTSAGVEVLYNGTSFCAACVDTQVSVFFELIDSGNGLRLTIANVGSDGVLTGVGFKSNPNLSDGQAPDLVVGSVSFLGGISAWELGEGGLGNMQIGVGTNGGPSGSGLLPGGSGIFEGALSAPLTSLTIDPTIVHVQAVALNGGNSIKPSGCVATDPSCGMTHAPEPASLVLLGSGLIGAGFAARRRRTNK